ncbi:MAG: acyl-CoA dehydrogenase family protein [Myxococcota bacterium]
MTKSARHTLENPTEEHLLLRQMVRKFTSEEVEPQADEHNRVGKLNRNLMERCGELGLHGITIPEADGGGGMDLVASTAVHHELSKSDPGFTLAYLAHAVLFVNNFYFAASPAQREQYLPGVLSGAQIGCMGMTEPGAGTDVIGMKTHARRDGDTYVLNGAKAMITNAPDCDVAIVYAKVEDRISTFIVERSWPGVTIPPKTPKMGMKASSLGELVFENVEVPKSHLLGEEGGGVKHMMRNLEAERLTLAAISLGIADRCLDIMTRYAGEREAFGHPIHHFGQIQRYIAESWAKTEAMRTLLYTVARDSGPDKRNRVGTDAAKLFASRAAKEVADDAMQVLGGWGYCEEFKVERFLRDAKLIEIGGGTIEAHQKNMTKDIMRALHA